MPIVEEYLTADGRNHYRDWFMGLAAPAAAKIAGAVARMAAGNTSNLKSISAGLAEWSIDWGPGLRIYVHQDGAELILLLGGSDKSGQASQIKVAAALLAEYKQRKKAAGQVPTKDDRRRRRKATGK